MADADMVGMDFVLLRHSNRMDLHGTVDVPPEFLPFLTVCCS
jgi:hypothetical protein